jgi:peptidoglycan/LPS O-acetylase OafA/YrhL
MTTYLRHILLALLPSFIRSEISPSAKATSKSSKSAIAGLDGLRGIACLSVFYEHFSYNYSHNFLYGYGVEDRHCIIQSPFIRVFSSGFSMMTIFFVISDYVLS